MYHQSVVRFVGVLTIFIGQILAGFINRVMMNLTKHSKDILGRANMIPAQSDGIMIDHREVLALEEQTRRQSPFIYTTANQVEWRAKWKPYYDLLKKWWASIPDNQLCIYQGETNWCWDKGQFYRAEKTSSEGWFKIEGVTTKGESFLFYHDCMIAENAVC